MNKLIDNLIHNKEDKRKLNILQILNNRKDYISSNDLASQLNCSNRTILNDISEFKKELPNSWKVMGVKSKGYILKKPITEPFSTIVMIFLKKSVLYKIILELFNNKKYTMEKWSQTLYINKQTLKNILDNFRPVLNDFNIDFNYRILEFVGCEINIRYFFIAFFASLQRHLHRHTLSFDLQDKIKMTLKDHKVAIDFNLLAIIIEICINRMSYKYFNKQKINTAFIFDSHQSKCFEEIISTIKRHYQIKTSENEEKVLQLFLFLGSKGSTQQKINIIDYFHNTDNKIYKNYLELLNDTLYETSIDMNANKNVVLKVGRCLYQMHIMNHYHIPIEYYLNLSNDLPMELQETYNKKTFLISNWNEEHNNHRFTKFEIRYITLNLCFQLLYFKRKKKNILFLYTGSTIEKNITYLNLKNLLGDSVNIFTEVNAGEKYDCIITNYQISNTTIPTIFISEILNDKNSGQFIHQVINNKEKI